MMQYWRARREVRRHVSEWVEEAIETYGHLAEETVEQIERNCMGVEQYAYRLVRKAIHRRNSEVSLAVLIWHCLKEAATKGPTLGIS